MNISGSSADRASVCPASHALPSIVQPTNEAAERGNIIHEYIRAKLTKSKTSLSDEYREFCESIQLDTILSGIEVLDVEASFLLDLKSKTVKYLGSNLGRRYPPHTPYEIPLTIDVVGRRGTEIIELDWKSGLDVNEPGENWQRKLCSIALMLYYNTSGITSKNVYLRENGEYYEDPEEFSVIDLYAFIDEFCNVVDAVLAARDIVSNGGIPNTYPGEQCKYCPSYSFCPAKTALVRKFSEDLTTDDLKLKLLSLRPEQQGVLLERVREVAKMAKEAGDILKEVAERNPLPIDDEYMYGPVKRTYSGFSKEAAIDLLQNLGATEEQIKNLTHKSTTIQIRKVKRQ